MSPSTDRSSDPSPFAWIFGSALVAIAVAAVARAARGRRPGERAASDRSRPGEPVVRAGRTADDAAEDPSLEGHPS